MSFFDDGEETASRPSSAPRRPKPRQPGRGGGAGSIDQHTLMVRRLVFAGAAVVLLIVIVLLVNGCLKSEKQQSLKDYNHAVSLLAQESDEQVSRPLFGALTGAAAKPALNVEVQVNQLRTLAQAQASRAQSLSVPGEMVGAQRALLSTLNLRAEGMTKVAAHLPAALAGQEKTATTKIAGDMELFLASDVIYAVRVAPLIQETLAANGIHGLSTSPSRFLPNLGWLDPNTVAERITGKSSGSSTGAVAPGTHGDSLVGVSVGTTTLEPEPTINHISGGGNPTFTVTVEDTGSNPETNIKVDVTVTASGKQFKASHVINSIQPGSKANVEIPVSGVPLGVGANVEVVVEAVPGETELENNKAKYLAIFSQ